MPSIHAVLFDLDDTLVDTAALTTAAIIETLATAGCVVAPEQIDQHRTTGRPLRGWFTDDLGLPIAVAEAAYWSYVETIKSRAALTNPMAGADVLLKRLHATGMPMAIVTTRLLEIALPIVSAAGWLDYFRLIVGQETAARPKPAPDPALHALEALGVDPARAAFIGDTESDMLCGAAAGIGLLIGLAGERPTDALYAAGAMHVCTSLAEIGGLLLPERSV
jgi:HAD superfamily hydrolase (TIGR01509 family)